MRILANPLDLALVPNAYLLDQLGQADQLGPQDPLHQELLPVLVPLQDPFDHESLLFHVV